MEISKGQLVSSSQYNLKDSLSFYKQRAESSINSAKEWGSQKLHDLGLTAQAWVYAINSNPLFQELRQAVIETAKESAQDFAAQKLGQLASHSPDITNAALNVSATLNDVRTSLNHPIAHTLIEVVRKRPDGRKMDARIRRAGKIVNIFTDSMRENRLATEPI